MAPACEPRTGVRSNNSSSIALSSHFRSSSILSPCKSPFKFAFASCCSCMLSGDVDAHNTSGGLTSERMPCFAGHQRQWWPNNQGRSSVEAKLGSGPCLPFQNHEGLAVAC